MNQYKKRRIGDLLISVVVLLAASSMLLSLFGNSFVEESNNDVEVTAVTKKTGPSFNYEGGFYDEPIQLEIMAPEGCEIYYTLDSSDPSVESIKYTGPITLDNASNNPNVYSMREDVTVGFYSEIIKKYNAKHKDFEISTPNFLVDKCNVVKAIYVNSDGKTSDITVASYFVGLDMSKYEDCSIISITTDPSNLFDYEKGIYVTGKVFDDFLSENLIIKNTLWHLWDANYNQRGVEWQRDCFCEFFDINKNTVLNIEAGIRTQGNVSRGAVPRGLNLFVDDEYEASLFDNGIIAKKMTLSAGGTEPFTKMYDYLMSKRVISPNFSMMEYQPYVLFLEGEYWGFYWLCDAYDENYISYNYNVDKDNILMIKNNEVQEGDDSKIYLYERMKADIISSDMSKEENYLRACELVDIDSFVDYYATMIYIARQADWPDGNNTALWRTVEKEDSAYGDTKWRWMLFDCNSASMSYTFIDHNTLDYVIEEDSLFAAFWKNDSFKELFKTRILKIADEYFDGKEMVEFIDDYIEEYFGVLNDSWLRFFSDNENLFEYMQEYLKDTSDFFENRKEIVEAWFY